jgi:ketosteroid isomerase-like protein
MTCEEQLISVERAFRQALLKPDPAALETLLAEDWALTDVTRAVVSKAGLIANLASGDLRFDALDMGDTLARTYGDTTVITGQSAMRASYKGSAFSGNTRYTHVYVKRNGQWQMVAAQGTAIAS